MTESQPALLSAALIERDTLVLAAHRKQGRRPFGGQWLLPMTAVSMFGLAAATLARSANVGVAASLAVWALIVLAGARGGDLATAVEQRELVPLYLLATVFCLGMTLYATSDGRNGRLRWQ